jgi:hypothetical protein
MRPRCTKRKGLLIISGAKKLRDMDVGKKAEADIFLRDLKYLNARLALSRLCITIAPVTLSDL